MASEAGTAVYSYGRGLTINDAYDTGGLVTSISKVKVKVSRGSLEIVSDVNSALGLCGIDDQSSASHNIEFKNYGWRKVVTVDSVCQTSCVWYLGIQGRQRVWKEQVEIPFIPGSGKCGMVARSQGLTSHCVSRDECIKTDFQWYQPGVPTSFGRKSILTQVRTL